jgi:hypothetical protein
MCDYAFLASQRRRFFRRGGAIKFASAFKRLSGVAVATVLTAFAATTPASAAYWHGGGWGGGWYGGWRGGYGGWYGWGPFLGGALIGSAIASYPYYGYYGYPYYGYGYGYPYPYNPAAYAYPNAQSGHCIGYQVTYDQHGHVIGRRRVSIC